MEKRMEQYAQELSKENDIKGVICANDSGGAYFCHGSLNETSAAAVSQLAALSSALEQNAQPTAVVMASTSSKIMLKKNGCVVVGIHK
ncbi:ragulator complex protein LAMTOR5 domain-containing protein [Ditylenchus destructor]|uniref:Late endosomal/lysosomal adaptor and MAPK and MTOR activator 5 n=1 Tax=Ditylenchus destructor TaxID=166010 RepID=A0AAD4R5U2_9BILA|nr:ragulator complex protein LAMTOR5 domain-containing protein [Ditylenchus destructor]